MVPGPDMSAKTLTNENAPLIIPNPSPETENKENEPLYDKTNKITVCPAKTQISLGIRPV